MDTARGAVTGTELGSPRARRALGAGALVALLVASAWPIARTSLKPAPTPVATLSRDSSAIDEAEAAVAHLHAAAANLTETAHEVLTARGAAAGSGGSASALSGPSRGATSATDPITQCLQGLVPPGTFGAGRLDWVCEQSDVWQLQLDLYGRVASRGHGPGVALWARLGHYELGAIALLRATCCPGAPALVVEVPTERCGSPGDALASLAPSPKDDAGPTPEAVERYADTLQCLANRRVWLPKAWAGVGPTESRRAFDDFLTGLAATSSSPRAHLE